MNDVGIAKLAAFKAAVDRLEKGTHRVDLSEATFLCPAACAFLVGVRQESSARGVVLNFESTGCTEAVARHLEMSGVVPGLRRSRTTIPVTRFTDVAHVGRFLKEEWLAQLRGLSMEATEYVLLAAGEIFVNAFQHSGSRAGVFSCGQYYGKTNELHLTVVDLGIGIPGSVAAAFGRREEELDGGKAIRRAFQPGNSAVPTSRGFGLAILARFIAANGGALKVYSRRGYAR